jgi:hypothetical protein
MLANRTFHFSLIQARLETPSPTIVASSSRHPFPAQSVLGALMPDLRTLREREPRTELQDGDRHHSHRTPRFRRLSTAIVVVWRK